MMGGQLHLTSVLGKGTRIDVALVLALTTEAPVSLSVPHIPPARALNILVVDDYPANRVLLARQLSFLGHHIVTADDGEQGLALWQSGHFDGVITDCNMPLKDGYALTRDIRAQERQRGLVPCLVLGFTANAQPEETARCRQAGMDGCLFKPTGLEDLRSALAPLTAHAATNAAEPVFDLSALISLTGGDKAALDELLAPLLASLKEDRAVLPALYEQRNLSKLHDLAHRVKGGARMVKAQVLIACAETLETVCERQQLDALGAAVEAIGLAIDSLHHSLALYCNQT
jgi:two-component system sensor histidine kinase EvgS